MVALGLWSGVALVAVAAIWLAHRRWPDVPLGWPLSAALSALLMLFMLLGIGGGSDAPWVLWLPEPWSQAWGLRAAWDLSRWLTLLLAATLLVALVWTDAPRAHEHPFSPREWTLWWLTAVVMAWSLLPGTPTGVWWAWAVVDIWVLVVAFILWTDGDTRVRWLWHTTARALAWVAALAWSALQPTAALTEPVDLPAARTVLLAAVLWRWLWPGPREALPRRADLWQRGGRGWLAWTALASGMPVLAALARWPVPEEALWWEPWLLAGLALLALWSGAARWLATARAEDGWPGLLALWGSVAVLAAYAGLPHTALFWAGLAWAVGAAVVGLALPERRMLAFWFLLALGVLALLPMTPGQAGAALWLQAPLWARLAAALAVVLGLMGAAPVATWQGRALEAQPRWVQVFYPLGAAALLAGLARWGLALGALGPQVPASPLAWAVGPGLLAFTGLVLWVLWGQRERLEAWSRSLLVPLRFFAGLLVALYRGTVAAVENALYFLSLVFEGESSLMWSLVFLAALALFFYR